MQRASITGSALTRYRPWEPGRRRVPETIVGCLEEERECCSRGASWQEDGVCETELLGLAVARPEEGRPGPGWQPGEQEERDGLESVVK